MENGALTSSESSRCVDLIRNIPIGIYRNTPGPKGHFIEVNPAAVAMFEASSKEEMLRHSVSDLYQDASARAEFVKKLLSAGRVKDEVLALKTLKGKRIWGQVSAVMVKDASGEVFFDGTCIDVTERVLAQQALERERNELERMNSVLVGRELRMQELKADLKRAQDALHALREANALPRDKGKD